MIKRFTLCLILLAAFGAASVSVSTSHAAVNGFYAGRIIDDGVFTNSRSMSTTDIQNFLNSKVPVCDTNGTQMYNATQTRAQVAASIGKYPPFICLKDYSVGGKTSAQIIYDTAQQYEINPQVLIVLLQKEQGLVTDTWPYDSQYRSATGYGCPDTAACDSTYYGFANQVNWAARMYRAILNASPTWYTPYILGNNYIQYNPSSSCGGSTVNIENRATQALYNYTPYQPNQATLDAGWGTAPCGAYGNRNFYLYFTGWFGSVRDVSYQARFQAQSPPQAEPLYFGESRTVYVQYVNTGYSAWYDDTSVPSGYKPVHLAASNPINRQSAFSYGWPSAGRPAVNFSKVYLSDGVTLSSNQHVVLPGEVARFEFTLTPAWAFSEKSYREYFRPVLEGADNWDLGGEAWLDIPVESRYKAKFVSQTSNTTIKRNSDITQNSIRLTNSGSAAWYDSTSTPTGYRPIQLVASAPYLRASQFASSWQSSSVAATVFSKVYLADGTTPAPDQHIVMPGQIGEFTFNMQANEQTSPGVYREYFQPVIANEPNNPFMGLLAWYDITVQIPQQQATFNLQSSFPNVTRGQGSPAFLQYKNTGTSAWYDDTSVPSGYKPVHLAASNPINRQSAFSYGWPSAGRPAVNFSKVYLSDGVTLSSNQHVVLPGEVARFEFTLTAPWTINYGLHREYFQPVVEQSNSWHMSGVAWLDVTVHQ